ncbi:hypothetical protein NL676_039772 [Syzygium grande]|nr:hypothetical protein NL676_039772 [Syzygium grande]
MSTCSSSSSSSSSPSPRCKTPRTSSLPLDLPLDLLYHALFRVPTTSLLKLRTVCREWRDIIDDPHFAAMQITSGIKTTRILLVHDSTPEKRGFALDANFLSISIPKIARMYGLYKARGSCHGLLCFEDIGLTYLFNPLTREIATLTTARPSRLRGIGQGVAERLHSIGIGVDRLTSRYKIVRVIYSFDPPDDEAGVVDYPFRTSWPDGKALRAESPRAEVLDQGSRSWRDIGIAPSSLIPMDPVFAAGSIHWKAKGTGGVIRICSFDIAKEEFAPTPCPKLRKDAHLVDLQGVLGLVDCKRKESIDVWVMEEGGRWMKEYSVRLPSPVGSGYRLVVLGCGGRRSIALNRRKSCSPHIDAVGRENDGALSGGSWAFCDPGADDRRADAWRPPRRATALGSITLSLLSPAKLWNAGSNSIALSSHSPAQLWNRGRGIVAEIIPG